jgi:predicted  nucleic acid-binding Zn-ribbon protein
MADMKDIKEKFSRLQNEVTKLNNQKIGMESEIRTIEEDMNDLGDKILSATGKGSLEDAFEYFKEQNDKLEDRKEKLSLELDKYLDIDSGSNQFNLG